MSRSFGVSRTFGEISYLEAFEGSDVFRRTIELF